MSKHFSYEGKRYAYVSDELFQFIQDIERSLDTILYTKQSIQYFSEHVLNMNINDFCCKGGYDQRYAIIKRFVKLRVHQRTVFESKKIIKNVQYACKSAFKQITIKI